MPPLGLGLWGLPGRQAEEAVRRALALGYRLLDTGDHYGNEAAVGRAVRQSGIPREEVFLTTKAWHADGYDATLRAFDASVRRLRLEPVDLYLIHWPRPDPRQTLEAWRALELLRKEGRARAVGVSNFDTEHLRHLLAESGTPPSVNQVELHPRYSRPDLRALHAAHGIRTEAWGPLGRGRGLLKTPVLARIGHKHGRSPAQVVLRWHLQTGTIAIPKSARPERLAANLDVFGFALDQADLAAIAALDADEPVGPTRQPR
ncbi:aldo/keto reductase [Streptomyces sp. NPDC046939]|uniref:aldo/keto reductase n=1 Tax=Streptomyces sp. NPDC046939 TaxID=3155376 RepID=UPI0033DA382C